MLPTTPVIEEVSKLQPVKCMRATVNSSVKYGAIVGAATAISGIIGGPIGLAVGGLISSCVVGIKSHGEFKSVPYILLHETTPQQREKLAKLIRDLVKSLHINTIRDFILSIENNAELQQAVIQIVIAFLASELGATVRT